ncbi:hypothetical protein T439DRAFT_173799 [Meredithblackwellia eburnea MCA 4105]
MEAMCLGGEQGEGTEKRGKRKLPRGSNNFLFGKTQNKEHDLTICSWLSGCFLPRLDSLKDSAPAASPTVGNISKMAKSSEVRSPEVSISTSAVS